MPFIYCIYSICISDTNWDVNIWCTSSWDNGKLRLPFSPQFPILLSSATLKKRLFLRSTSWPGRLLLFWMSHCLREHGRGDSEWCWMFYDCLLLCRTFPALLWDSDGEPGLLLLDLTAEELTHTQAGTHARTYACTGTHARTSALNIWGASIQNATYPLRENVERGESIQKLNK